MADNFNYKQFLMENRLGAYSKIGLNEATGANAEEAAQKMKERGASKEAVESYLRDKLDLDDASTSKIVAKLFGAKEGMEDHDVKGMQADLDAMLKGDEDDAPSTINNPRNPKEVAAAIKAQNSNIGTSWSDIATAAQPLMVAAFQAHGMDHEKATTATRILLGGTHSTYSDFPQDLYDAVVGGGMEEAQLKLDQDGAQVSEAIEEGSSSALDSLNNIEGMLLNLKKNVATDSTIGTESKQGLLQAFAEMMEELQTIGYELEVDNDQDHISDYMNRRASEN